MRELSLFAFFIIWIIYPCWAVSPFNLENCEEGSFFVENYVKYECYDNDNLKGAKIVGCQPSNDLTGETLGAWQTFNERWFKYHCVIDGNNAQYSVKACLDPSGELLPVGKTRSFPGGETFTCFMEKNKVKLNHQTTVGCRVGEKVYGDRATWIEKREDTVSIDSKQKVVGLGTANQCQKTENGSFVIKFAACLTSQNTFIRVNEYGTVNDEIVKCDIQDKRCQLRVTRLTEISCFDGHTKYSHNQEWDSLSEKTAYACHFGKIVKKGCLANSILIPLNSVRYVNGTAYYCSAGIQLRSFGNLKGCTTVSGEIIPFENKIKEGDKMNLCSFVYDETGVIQFKWIQIGCIHSKEMITVNAIQVFEKNYVHCASNGTNGYVAKFMTKIEVERWLNATQQQWSNVMSGHEGQGIEVIQEVSTAMPTHNVLATPETTKTKETVTTTAQPSLKPVLTTTFASPTTTAHTIPLITTLNPVIPILPVQKPVTENPTTTCEDFIENCHHLELLCYTKTDKVSLLKESIRKSLLSFEKKSTMLNFIDELLKDMCEDVEDCMCTDKFDSEKCWQNCFCKSQEMFKVKLVRSLCPKTCNICGEKREAVSSIISNHLYVACPNNTCSEKDRRNCCYEENEN